MSTPTQEPYNLSSATITGNASAMTISWDHNTTNTVNYTLQYSWYDDNYSGATAPDVTVVANQTSYSAVISELEVGRKYYIKVTAVGTGGSLQSSSSTSFIVGNPQISNITGDFEEVLDSDEASGDVVVTLSFNDIDDRFKFRLFLTIAGSDITVEEKQITSTSMSVTVSRVFLLALDQTSSYSFKGKIYDASTDILQTHIDEETFSFSTSATYSPSYDNELALGVGDPYIKPLIGSVYKLPDGHFNYRYLDNLRVENRFLVNIQTGLLNQNELEETNNYTLEKIQNELGDKNVNEWMKENNFVMPSKSCFVNFIHMRNGEEFITIDTKNFNIFEISSFEHFTIENVENKVIEQSFTPYSTSLPISTIKISCDSQTYGKVSLYVYQFANLQLRNAFRIETEKSISLGNSFGAMIFKSTKEYMLPKLTSEKFVEPVIEKESKYIPQVFVTKDKVGAIPIRV